MHMPELMVVTIPESTPQQQKRKSECGLGYVI